MADGVMSVGGCPGRSRSHVGLEQVLHALDFHLVAQDLLIGKVAVVLLQILFDRGEPILEVVDGRESGSLSALLAGLLKWLGEVRFYSVNVFVFSFTKHARLEHVGRLKVALTGGDGVEVKRVVYSRINCIFDLSQFLSYV